LQHAWAEIEHDLGYKVGATIPVPVRRRFSRLAGLLEIADREFKEIRDELAAYASRVGQEIANSPSSVMVDDISLNALIESDQSLRDLDRAMADHVGATLYKSSDVGTLVNQMRYVNLLTIEDVRLALQKRKELVFRQWKQRVSGKLPKRDQMIQGISLFQLFQVLIAEKGSVADLRVALEQFEIGEPKERPQIAESVVRTVQEVRVQGFH